MVGQRIFLAFAHPDRDAARRISRQLSNAGLDVWDAERLRPGDDWAQTISEELQAAGVIVALVSPAAFVSDWVRREMEYAQVSRTPVVPVLLGGAEPYPGLSSIQHDRLRPDGTLRVSTVERIESVARRRDSGGASEVAEGVLRALDSRVLGDVVELQERIVLLLGNFAEPHYDRLIRVQAELRRRELRPIIFDFEHSPSSDYGETVRILAGLASFVIADMTDPRSVVMELQLIAPDTAVPIVPVITHDQEPVALFADPLGKYDWVLEPLRYESIDHLVQQLDGSIVGAAAAKREELRLRKKRVAASQVAGLGVNGLSQ